MRGHGGPSGMRIMSVPRYWLTIEEAAEYTGIEESAIRRDIRDGYLHPRRLGTKVAIVDAELERWVRIRRSSPSNRHHAPSGRSQGGSPSNGQWPERPSSDDEFSIEAWLQQTGKRS